MSVRVALLAALAATAACASPPDTNACAAIIDVPCSMGRMDAAGAWVVGGWSGDRVNYQALTTYAVCHGLGRLPTSVEVWASFTPDGALAQQIGNVAQVLPTCDTRVGVTSGEILLRNSGSQGFFVRIVIR